MSNLPGAATPPRTTELLKAAAEALDDMRDPFTHEWLLEHAVTADECFELSANLATGARLLINNIRDLGRGSSAARQIAAQQLVEAALGDLPGFKPKEG